MELKCVLNGPPSTPEIALDNAAIRAELANNLRRIKTGSYTEDHGSHFKHFSVAGVAHAAAAALEHATTHEQQLKGECLLLADVLRDAYEVIKTIEGEDTDESDGLTSLCLSIAHALALYDDQRITRNCIAVRQKDELFFLRQQLATARLALVQYGSHDCACTVCDIDDEGRHCACDCGYEAAIAAAEDKAANVELTGAARLYRAASSDQRERG